MAESVKKPGRAGNPGKDEDNIRDIVRNQSYSKTEWERITWSANELGLSPASYIRMAALLHTKQVIG